MPIGLVVYPELCHGCGNCVISCPVNALNSPEVAGGKGPTDDADLIMIVEDGEINLKHVNLCGKCGTCVETCPVNAIKLEKLEEAK
ncbi:4Fe-4S binding protein [Methanobacterium aggregans]|uniref:4Fe-4S binding protein n=1 Tax=Methanobacterium aggregans TaxID=1615586 RepID=UPI001AE7713E|nr:4Fe-4S binding protein [Methanobacterium aggregans]MBP2046133.1 4Fe-4S ferredoxin [Methanobacterium aggregans]